MCSLIEAFANQTWCQFVQRWTDVSGLRSCYRRMPSSLRTTRTQPAPTTRHRGTRSFPGLHAVDDICLSILAGVCIRYMRVRMPVAHKGEWRPKRAKQQKPPQGANSKKYNRSLLLSLYIYIYTIHITLILHYQSLYSIPKKKVRANPPKMVK